MDTYAEDLMTTSVEKSVVRTYNTEALEALVREHLPVDVRDKADIVVEKGEARASWKEFEES